jgi:hypothetical protein
MNEREITIRIKVSRRTAVWAAAVGLLCCAANEVVSESVTMTTYYPAPSGTYQKLTTTGGTVGTPVNTILARDAGSVGIGTSNPKATLDINGTLLLENMGYVQGAKCSREGMLNYDYTSHDPIYCNKTGIWQFIGGGVSIGVAHYLGPNNGAGNERGSFAWVVGNSGSGLTGSGITMTNIGANRNCIAMLGSVGESDDVGNQPEFGCRYDPGTGNIISNTHDNYNAACVWVCTN